MGIDGYLVSPPLLKQIGETIDYVSKNRTLTPTLPAAQSGQGMWVRLTAEGDPEYHGQEFQKPFPYKAERVVYDYSTTDWIPTDPEYTFDPDEDYSSTNLDEYVFEMNGAIGLLGQTFYIQLYARDEEADGFYWGFSVMGDSQFAIILEHVADGQYLAAQMDHNLVITGRQFGTEYPVLQEINLNPNIPPDTIVAVKKGRGNFYFSHNPTEIGLARITDIGECDAGSYVADTLDKDLEVVPNQEFGVDLPCLIEVMARQKLELIDDAGINNGEIVMWTKMHDKYYFKWDDPRLILGEDISPLDNENGRYLAFSPQGGTTKGIRRNFNPDTGKYEFTRLIAIGPAENEESPSEGETGVVRGLKITPLDDYNYKIELIDGNGMPIIPIDDIYPIPATPTFCSKLTFNGNSRMLKIETRRVEDNLLICTNEVKIPCCPGEGDDGGGDTDDPDDPYPPEEDDDETSDDCTPPDVQILDGGIFCYPISRGAVVAKVVSAGGGGKVTASYALDSVVIGGVDLTANFTLNDNGELWVVSPNLPQGTYTAFIEVTYAGTEPCPDYAYEAIPANFTIEFCECDDSSSGTEEDDGFDYCPTDCDQYTLTADGRMEVDITKWREADTQDKVNLSFKAMRFKFSPIMDVDNTLTRIDQQTGAIIRPENRVGNRRFRYVADINWAVNDHDGDKSKSWSITIPVSRNLDTNTTLPRTTGTANRQLKGRLDCKYYGSTDVKKRRLRCTFYFNNFIYGVGQDSSYAMPVVTKTYDINVADGTMVQTLTQLIGDDKEDIQGHDIIGVIRVSDLCPNDDWCFKINNDASLPDAAEAMKFGIKKLDNFSAQIYAIRPSNIVLATRTLNITATFCGDTDDLPQPSSPVCSITEDFEIQAAKVLETLKAFDAGGEAAIPVARGVAGEIVAKLQAVDEDDVDFFPPADKAMSWGIKDIFYGEEPVPDGSFPPFQVDNHTSGGAVVTAMSNLPTGMYTMTIMAQNSQMIATGEVLEQVLTIEIDKTATKITQSMLVG